MPVPLPDPRRRCRTAGRLAGAALAAGWAYGPGGATALRAQAASVSPAAVLVHPRTRTGALTVLNPHRDPIDVRLDLRYGYVASDSATGRTLVRFVDDSLAPATSAVPFLRVSPTRFRLAPGATQVVRLVAVPAADQPDGEYWARLGVLGTAADAAPPGGAGGEGATAAGVAVQVRTVLPVFYRRGAVATGLAAALPRPARVGDTLVVAPTFTRTGNAAALASVTVDAVDARGTPVASLTRPLAVYHALTPRYALPLSPAAAARVAGVQVRVSARRPDLPAELPLPLAPVTLASPLAP